MKNTKRVHETRWDRIRQQLDVFLLLDIYVNEKFPFIVHHPFFDSSAAMLRSGELVDITASEENLDKAREMMRERIELIDSVSDIVLQVNKPYLMTVFSYIEPYLDLADFSTMLSSIWTYMEFPSACPDVTLSKMIHYFQQADPKILMDDADYKMYQDLPEVVTVYRGVGDSIDGKSGNPKGLSYTTSYETAEWFSNRFGTGYVVKLEIPKERVLACFDGNESEVVVNTRGLEPIRMDMELTLEEDIGGIE